MYEALKDLSARFETYKTNNSDPEACASCGLCEDKCPQNLTIGQYLKDITTAVLGPKELP